MRKPSDSFSEVKVKCEVCKRDNHVTSQCFRFNQVEQVNRPQTIQRCFRCQSPNHLANACTQNVNIQPLKIKTEQNHVSQVELFPKQSDLNNYEKIIKVRNTNLVALIDTSSTLNLIKDRCLSSTDLVDSADEITLCRGFGNQQVTSTRSVIYHGDIDGHKHEIPAIVVPDDSMNVDAILGQPFLDSVPWKKESHGITFGSINSVIKMQNDVQ